VLAVEYNVTVREVSAFYFVLVFGQTRSGCLGNAMRGVEFEAVFIV